MLFAGNSLDKARRIFERFITKRPRARLDDQAANEGVAGVASDITVPSPQTVSTPHHCGEYDQRADHDHHNYELKEGGEVHIRPDTALPLSANRR
jgi:hypothetical protein